MSTENRMATIEATLAAITEALGIKPLVNTPKTTARVARRESVAPMATKGRLEDIVIEAVGANRSDGRMRLPKRMFNGRESLTVDGVKFTSLASDQGRSANFHPETIGAEVGDTVTFVHEGGSKWTAEIESGSRKRKATPAAKTATAKTVVARKATAAPKQVGRAVKVSTSKMSLVREAAKKFGKLARQNAADDFVNENIPATYENDPRQYLTSRENAQAKRVWKRQAGITLGEWVKLLSAEVYDD